MGQTTSKNTGVATATERSRDQIVRPSLWRRYKPLLLSSGTLTAAANGLLLGVAFVWSIAGSSTVARWIYLASAIVGGAPILRLAFLNIVRRFDLTAGATIILVASAAYLASLALRPCLRHVRSRSRGQGGNSATDRGDSAGVSA